MNYLNIILNVTDRFLRTICVCARVCVVNFQDKCMVCSSQNYLEMQSYSLFLFLNYAPSPGCNSCTLQFSACRPTVRL